MYDLHQKFIKEVPFSFKQHEKGNLLYFMDVITRVTNTTITVLYFFIQDADHY